MVGSTALCIILSILLNIGDAFNNINNFNNTPTNKIIINKCCPSGYYVKQNACVKHSENKPFSMLNIYDLNIYKTNKSFDDLFTILPGKFEDSNFTEQALNLNQLGYVPYVIEDGTLQLEQPNMYQRWTPKERGDFCVDFIILKNGTLTPYPKFWGVVPDESGFEPSDEYLTAASLVSCVFMMVVLLVYLLLPELQNLCGLILMAYVASLYMAFLLLAVIQLFMQTETGCIVLTLGIYYFFLASFCWMTVMSYDIWWTFRGYAKARPIHRRGEHFKFLMYCLYAFGVPLLMTIGLGVLNTVNMTRWPWFITPKVPLLGCFIEGEIKMLYLYTPLVILNVSNWIFYLMTAFNLWRLNRATAILDSAAAGTPAAHRTQMNRFMVYLKLAVVMGLNWLLEVVSFLYPGFKMWYLTDIYNILIGFVIFLIFVCKKKILRKLYIRVRFLLLLATDDAQTNLYIDGRWQPSLMDRPKPSLYTAKPVLSSDALTTATVGRAIVDNTSYPVLQAESVWPMAHTRTGWWYQSAASDNFGLRSNGRFYPGSYRSYSSSSSASDGNQETTTLQVCSNPKGSNGYSGTMRSI